MQIRENLWKVLTCKSNNAVRINSWLLSACLVGESVYDKIVTHQDNWKSNRIPTYFTCFMILYNAYCSIVQVNCFLVSLCLCCMRWIFVRRIKSIQNLNFRFGVSKNTSDFSQTKKNTWLTFSQVKIVYTLQLTTKIWNLDYFLLAFHADQVCPGTLRRFKSTTSQ